MSDLMTSARSPHGSAGSGLAVYGRVSRAEVIAQLRRSAQHDLDQAQIVMGTADDEFIVEQYRGVFARKGLTCIEPEPATPVHDKQGDDDERD